MHFIAKSVICKPLFKKKKLLYLQAAPNLSIHSTSKHTKTYVHFSPLSGKLIQLFLMLILHPFCPKNMQNHHTIKGQK